MKLRIGTRASQLATSQTGRVARALDGLGHTCEIITISTIGDRVTDRPFEQVGPPGVFVREIEEALLAGDIDVAVHSYKDLPTTSPEGLVVAAVPERLDASDSLLFDPGIWMGPGGLLPIPLGAVVGTSSSRRRALLLDLRPDLKVAPLRGNVPTRLRKCREEGYAAIILASSGLQRLADAGHADLQELRSHRLRPDLFIPAPSQGALAVQVRADDPALEAVAALDQPMARAAVEAERAVLHALEGGCQTAIGAWLSVTGERCTLYGALDREDGLRRATALGALNKMDKLVDRVIEDLGR
jgi:hydroxymethylbilane synthase